MDRRVPDECTRRFEKRPSRGQLTRQMGEWVARRHALEKELQAHSCFDRQRFTVATSVSGVTGFLSTHSTSNPLISSCEAVTTTTGTLRCPCMSLSTDR